MMANYNTEIFTARDGREYTLLVLNAQGKFPFSFGLHKAKLVLESLDEIREFVKDNEVPKEVENKSW
tara:strand:+ start:332 stop:532 length:201 start_codon:yes stop_codon:yes gene_type:complete